MNYYDILGVKRTATQEEIKSAYKSLVKKYHPDIYTGDKTFAQKKTSEINVAYDTLSVPELRQTYDDETFPKANYSYTPPEYTSSYNTNNRYSNYSNYRGPRDGSEHDYSTYANYGRPYSNYNRNASTNTTYRYSDDPFSDRIIKNVDKLSKNGKKKLIVLFIIIYLCIILSSVLQLKSFMESDKSKKSYELYNTTTSENIIEQNTIKDNTTNNIKDTTSTTYDLYEIFTENELQALYTQFNTTYGDDQLTYEEFKEALQEYLDSYMLAY